MRRNCSLRLLPLFALVAVALPASALAQQQTTNVKRLGSLGNVPSGSTQNQEKALYGEASRSDEPKSSTTTTRIGPETGTVSLYGADAEASSDEEGTEPEDEGTLGAQETRVPELHSVTKGDTLWGISQKYWSDPWRWPEVWAQNPLITNPHWIFPGDVIRLLSAEEAAAPPTEPEAQAGQGLKRTNSVLYGDTNVVDFREMGFVDARELAVGAFINGSREEKIMLSSGDQAYVAFPKSRPLRAGERYSIYRPDERNPVRDPQTNEVIGYMVHVIGDVVIDQITEGQMARGTLFDLLEPAERNYKVGPVFRQFRTIEPKPSNVSIESLIAATIRPVKLLGPGMLVVMNKGKTAGVELGNRWFIVRRGDGYKRILEDWEAQDPRFPKEVVAELMAVDVRENLTIAWVVRSTKELRIGDVGEMRRGY